MSDIEGRQGRPSPTERARREVDILSDIQNCQRTSTEHTSAFETKFNSVVAQYTNQATELTDVTNRQFALLMLRNAELYTGNLNSLLFRLTSSDKTHAPDPAADVTSHLAKPVPSSTRLRRATPTRRTSVTGFSQRCTVCSQRYSSARASRSQCSPWKMPRNCLHRCIDHAWQTITIGQLPIDVRQNVERGIDVQGMRGARAPVQRSTDMPRQGMQEQE